ncbi:MAG: 1-acyl-sn-glycerol-3-phosphate acyltransferase [Deltaproteobacteria bacterium]|nr:MAG: 1-acyl-sn-glycerol-3-phosphate acyltransferase [Deltaproteobacteria bacterium]
MNAGRPSGDDGVAADLPPVVLPEARPVDKLVAAGLWGVGLSWLVPMLSTMTVAHKLLPGRELEPLNRLYCWGQLKLLGVRWRAEVHPDVDPAQPYMFAQNHTNHFDHVALYNATSHYKQGIELKKHFDYPFYGWFMKARGTIGVDKGKGGQSPEVMAQMRAEVARGHSILGFPEGTRTRTGRVGPFRKGLFFIARDLGLPVCPVAVTGMYEVMRKGSPLLRPGGVVTVHVGPPLPTAGLSDDEVPALAEQVREVVAGHVDRYWERHPTANGRRV